VEKNCDLNTTIVCSADHYRYEDGKYVFRQETNESAHEQCFDKFVTTVDKWSMGNMPELTHVVVDNTNIHAWEIAPYYAYARRMELGPSILTILDSPISCAKRNIHGVPEEKVFEMSLKLEKETLPPHWKSVTVFSHDLDKREWV
jgi:hypothetical protein